MPDLRSNINNKPWYLFYTHLMPFIMYRDNYSDFWSSFYPYTLGRALNEYKINAEEYFLYCITMQAFKKSYFILFRCQSSRVV